MSEISKFVYALLERQKEPKDMKWIVVKACEHFHGAYQRYEQQAFHRKVWNAVYCSCVSPSAKPRLKQVKKKIKGVKLNLFQANK